MTNEQLAVILIELKVRLDEGIERVARELSCSPFTEFRKNLLGEEYSTVPILEKLDALSEGLQQDIDILTGVKWKAK